MTPVPQSERGERHWARYPLSNRILRSESQAEPPLKSAPAILASKKSALPRPRFSSQWRAFRKKFRKLLTWEK